MHGANASPTESVLPNNEVQLLIDQIQKIPQPSDAFSRTQVLSAAIDILFGLKSEDSYCLV